jgi:hypothetical protein
MRAYTRPWTTSVRDDLAPKDDGYRSAILLRRAGATVIILFAASAIASVVL